MTNDAIRPTTANLETRRLPLLALIGGAVGTAVNVLIALIAPALIGGAVQVAAPGTNVVQDLPLFPVIAASLLPAFVGAGVLWLLGRFTNAPVRNFQILGVVVALLSLISPFGLPVSLGSRITLAIMHVVAAGSIIVALSRAKRT